MAGEIDPKRKSSHILSITRKGSVGARDGDRNDIDASSTNRSTKASDSQRGECEGSVMGGRSRLVRLSDQTFNPGVTTNIRDA